MLVALDIQHIESQDTILLVPLKSTMMLETSISRITV